MKKAVQIIVNNAGGIGAYDDETRYKEFFGRLIGGAWNPREILPTLVEPSRFRVIERLKKIKALGIDYLVLVFSGHGGMSKDEENTTLCLKGRGGNKMYEILDVELCNYIPRQLIILDCCRVRQKNSLVDFLSRPRGLIKEANSSCLTRMCVRAAYERAIEATEDGNLLVYACAPGKSTTGADREGGVFSNYLKSKFWISRSTPLHCANIFTISESLSSISNLPRLNSPTVRYSDDSLLNLPWMVMDDKFVCNRIC